MLSFYLMDSSGHARLALAATAFMFHVGVRFFRKSRFLKNSTALLLLHCVIAKFDPCVVFNENLWFQRGIQ